MALKKVKMNPAKAKVEETIINESSLTTTRISQLPNETIAPVTNDELADIDLNNLVGELVKLPKDKLYWEKVLIELKEKQDLLARNLKRCYAIRYDFIKYTLLPAEGRKATEKEVDAALQQDKIYIDAMDYLAVVTKEVSTTTTVVNVFRTKLEVMKMISTIQGGMI